MPMKTKTVWAIFALVLCLARGTQAQTGSACGLDIVMALDGSASLSYLDWLRLKDVVAGALGILEIGPKQINVGITVFSTDVTYVSPQLSANKSELIDLVKNRIEKPDTGTFTNLAITASTRLLQTSRPDVADVIIIITDGATETKAETVASVAAATRAGITIYAIGLGRDISFADLQLLTDASRILSAVDVNGLLVILNGVTARACVEVSTVTTPSTTTARAPTTTTTTTPTPPVINTPVCPGIAPTNIWLLNDMSSGAESLATRSSRFDQVQEAIIAFLGDPSLTAASPVVKLGVVNYNSAGSLVTKQLTPYNQAKSTFTNVVPDFGLTSGNYYTTNGLQAIRSFPHAIGTDDWVVLITSVDTTTQSNTDRALAEASFLQNAGYRIYTIGVMGPDGTLANDELSKVSLSGGLARISNYRQLTDALAEFVQTKICPVKDVSSCDCAWKSGTYNIADNSTCHRFWMCDKKDDVYSMQQFDCAPGTLFSTSTANCVAPQNYNCPAWNGYCKVGQLTSFYPHLCCAKYWECTNGNVYDRTCPSGQYFDNSPAVKRCRVPDATNFCLNNALCSKGTNVCNHVAVPTDPCSYIITDNPSGPLVRPCQPGSAFNKDTCVCSDPAPPSCIISLVPGVGEVDTSRGNINCKALFHMDMTTRGRNLTVLSDNTNTVLPIYVDRQSTTAQNGAVTFNGRALTDATSYGKISDVLFVPYFAKRSFPNSWAFSLDFRFSAQADRREYVLVTNDNCLSCVATYRLTATRADMTSSQWTFKFWVQTASTQGYELVDREQAEISASIAITNNNQWSKVVVRVQLQNPATVNTEGYKAVLSGTVSTASPANPSTNIQQAFSTATINNRVKYNECGLSLGQGRDGPQGSKTTVALKGEIDDFKFYECSDLSNLV